MREVCGEGLGDSTVHIAERAASVDAGSGDAGRAGRRGSAGFVGWYARDGGDVVTSHLECWSLVGVMPEVRRFSGDGGVSIAFYEFGVGGDLLLLFPYHVNHLEFTWATPLHRQAIVRLAESFHVVNVDLRGTGLSTRAVDEVSISRHVEDVVQLLDHLAVEATAVCAMGNAMPIAFQLAVTCPDRISSIAVVGAGVSPADGQLFDLHKLDPQLQFEARASLVAGLNDPLNAAALATTMKNAVDAPTLSRYMDGVRATDVPALLAAVRSPVLLLNGADDKLITLASAYQLADGLPHVTVLPADGDSAMSPWRSSAAIDALVGFLATGVLDPSSVARPSRDGRSPMLKLTPREAQVLTLITQGRSNRQIADELYISVNTVSHHLRGIFAKTGAHSRTEAAAYAHRNGLT